METHTCRTCWGRGEAFRWLGPAERCDPMLEPCTACQGRGWVTHDQGFLSQTEKENLRRDARRGREAVDRYLAKLKASKQSNQK